MIGVPADLTPRPLSLPRPVETCGEVLSMPGQREGEEKQKLVRLPLSLARRT